MSCRRPAAGDGAGRPGGVGHCRPADCASARDAGQGGSEAGGGGHGPDSRSGPRALLNSSCSDHDLDRQLRPVVVAAPRVLRPRWLGSHADKADRAPPGTTSVSHTMPGGTKPTREAVSLAQGFWLRQNVRKAAPLAACTAGDPLFRGRPRSNRHRRCRGAGGCAPSAGPPRNAPSARSAGHRNPQKAVQS